MYDRRLSARRLRTSLAVVAAGGVLAGCGTASVHMRAAAQTRPAVRASARATAGGSPREARAVGRRMLRRLVLPPGARRTERRPVPQRAQVIGSDNLADVSRFFWVPGGLQAVYQFLHSHVPAGTAFAGDGLSTPNPGQSEMFVWYSLKSAPAGILGQGDNELLVSLARDPNGGTLVRADAEVVWYPPRTAAEYLRPSHYTLVRITATFTSPSRPSVTITKNFKSPTVIARLAGLLNRLHTIAPPGIPFCPAFNAEFRLVFSASAGHHTAVVAAYGCSGDTMTVDGKPQPPLDDFESERVLAVIGPLLGHHGRMW